MELKNKKVIIIGMARSGFSAAKLCCELGAEVILYDKKNRESFQEIIREFKSYPVEYAFGDFDGSLLEGIDYMILSPGVPTDLPFIEKGREMGICVLGEIELAFSFCKAPIIGITGTNGKTTTTTLVGEIMKTVNQNTYVVGNIGNPFTSMVLNMEGNGVVVAEISSFQLETIHCFRPRISAVLNIREDHLNRHKTFENYIQIKERITMNQNERDFCILNYDDPICRNMAKDIPSKIIWFSMRDPVQGVYYKDGMLMWNLDGEIEEVLSVKDAFLFGKHNIENMMASIGIAKCWGVPTNKLNEALKSFKGVEHRIEFVCEKAGVKIYNDSKATNPDSAIAAIRAMEIPTVLIGGGMDKGNSFEEWIMAFDQKVKALIVFGETKYKIKNAAENCGYKDTVIVEDLEEAVRTALNVAKSGDAILLSPACASWDMFESYEERGNLFKELIETL